MGSNVVSITKLTENIAQICMEDRDHKNTFSQALITGLTEAFEWVEQQTQLKAVVLTGYDSYFATGGTQEELLLLQEGKMQFTDINIYRLALDCKIPVIAAMQGHGIGGGLMLGLFCDVVVLSEESIYAANFMSYGFTPGMGATYILPKKVGFSLGQEMLMNAQRYRGSQLKERGVPFPVLPRKQVLDYAVARANELAEKPRNSLIILKDHLVSSIRNDLPAIIHKEVIMHDKTFNQPEVKVKINQMFGR